MTRTEILYHGTSSKRAEIIEHTGVIRCAPYGDRHVSLTTDFQTAWYFADMACHGDWEFGSTKGYPVVFAIRKDHLVSQNYELLEFESAARSNDEHEIACIKDIKIADVPFMRWEPRLFQFIGEIEI